eukprot:gene17790-biopygen28116
MSAAEQGCAAEQKNVTKKKGRSRRVFVIDDDDVDYADKYSLCQTSLAQTSRAEVSSGAEAGRGTELGGRAEPKDGAEQRGRAEARSGAEQRRAAELGGAEARSKAKARSRAEQRNVAEGRRGAEARRGAEQRRRRGRRGGWRERFTNKGGREAQQPQLVAWNARGLMVKNGHKHLELAEMAAERMPGVIGITESLLDDTFKDGEIDIPSYRIIRRDRDLELSKKKKGGGVVVYIREDLEEEEESRQAGEDFELGAFNLLGIRTAIVYRPPGASISEGALRAIEKEMSSKGHRLFAGDLNMNMKAQTPVPRELRNMLEKELGMEQRVNSITRHRGKEGSTNDHVWTSMQCRCSLMRALDGLSDHRAITAIHAPQEAPNRQHKQTTVKTCLWKEASTVDIVKLVKEEMQKRIYRRNTRRSRDERVPANAETLEELLDDWDHACGTVKRELVPEKCMRVGKPRRARLFKKEIKEGIKERQRKEEATRSGIEGPQLDKALEELKQVTKGVRKRIVNAKREYVQKEISALPEGRITDRKEGWCVWDRLMERKKKCKAEPVGSADECNYALLQKVEKIREPLLQFPVRSPEERAVAELRGIKPVTADDVKKALSRDKGTKSVGIDGIPMSVLKR